MADPPLVHSAIPARSGPGPHAGLLLLHGLGSNEMDMHTMAGQLADPRVVIVSARAPFATPWGGYAWYDIAEHDPGYTGTQRIGASIDLLRRFLDTLVSDYSVDPRRLYVGGFSQGGAMSAALALLEPERVAGAIILSGFLPIHANLPYRPRDAAGHPIFQAHGTMDQVVSITYGRMTRDYLTNETAVSLTYHEYPMGHEVCLAELQDLRSWMDGVLVSQENPV